MYSTVPGNTHTLNTHISFLKKKKNWCNSIAIILMYLKKDCNKLKQFFFAGFSKLELLKFFSQ